MPAAFDERREAQARAYDRGQALLFLLRFALLFALAAAFWTTGGSRELAAGLRNWFPHPFAWPLVCAGLAALATFGYEVALFPLSVLADFTIERHGGRLHAEFGAWLRGYVVTLLLETGLMAAAFTGLYVLMRLYPVWGWLAATGAYALLVPAWASGGRRGCCRACARRCRPTIRSWNASCAGWGRSPASRSPAPHGGISSTRKSSTTCAWRGGAGAAARCIRPRRGGAWAGANGRSWPRATRRGTGAARPSA